MTGEDKKLILEWCGWHTKKHSRGWLMWYSPTERFMGNEEPFLDLNFYFKYAVPKAVARIAHIFKISIQSAYEISFRWWLEELLKDPEDPAEAFGQALLKLIKEKKWS